MHENDFADSIDESTRIAASQFREIKKTLSNTAGLFESVQRLRRPNIDSVLEQVTLVEDMYPQAKPEEQLKEPTEGPKVDPKVLKDVLLEEKAPAFFSKVLKKEASDPAFPVAACRSRRRRNKSMRLLSYKLGCKERLQLDQRQVREAKRKAKLSRWPRVSTKRK